MGLNWEFYDAFTGDYLFTLTNIPGQGFFGPASNTAAMIGPEGEYLIAFLVNYGTPTSPNWYLQEWNSSRIWDNEYSGESTTPDIPPPITNGADPSLYDFNVSVPWLNTATLNGAPIGSMTVSAGIQGDTLLAFAGNLPNPGTFVFAMPPQAPLPMNGSESTSTQASVHWVQSYGITHFKRQQATSLSYGAESTQLTMSSLNNTGKLRSSSGSV